MPRLKETILIIEDDAAIREGLILNLRAEGYQVCAAETAQEGLALARTRHPDLLLLDLMLPDGSGLDILTTLRRDDQNLQVIILTARGLEEDKVKGLRLGADDYLTKPFGLAELLARIDAALRRTRLAARHGEGRLRFGDICLERDRHEVWRGQQQIKLTVREYEFLLFLVEHAGRVLTRAQILDAIWGEQYEGTPRTVDNFACALRNKIEADPDNPVHIITVHGIGYRFQP